MWAYRVDRSRKLTIDFFVFDHAFPIDLPWCGSWNFWNLILYTAIRRFAFSSGGRRGFLPDSATGVNEASTRSYFPETWLWQLNAMPLVWSPFGVFSVYASLSTGFESGNYTSCAWEKCTRVGSFETTIFMAKLAYGTRFCHRDMVVLGIRPELLVFVSDL